MKKTEMMNEIFKEWKERKLLFCEDGIVDEDGYNEADIKILFVLKDVNNPIVNSVEEDEKSLDGINIDMRRIMREKNEKDKGTWKTLLEWLKALLKVDFIPVNQLAFINLKKDEGQGSVSASTVRQYAKRDADLIRKQIEIISPDLVIVCGSDAFESLAQDVYNLDKNHEYHKITFTDKMNNHGRYFNIPDLAYTYKKVCAVEYRHPSRYRDQGTTEEHCQNMLTIRETFLPLA